MPRLAALLAFCAPLALFAQSSATPQLPAAMPRPPDPIAIVNWSDAALRRGLSAYLLLEAKVRNPRGEEVGAVEDIIVNTSGRVVALEVQRGGLLGVGGETFRVPWHAVEVAEDASYVVAGDQQNPPGVRPREYRVTDLLDDAVTIVPGVHYGNVDDLILTRRGEVRAIVVDADASGPPGRYAYPWARERYEPDAGVYRLPYDRMQIRHLKPFDYSRLEIPVPQGVLPADRGQSPN